MKTPKPSPAKLLAWYDIHRRVFPWRALPGERPDPYRVWLSEMMLQQTTVATVGPYFTAFLAKWPRVQDLARAEREDILRAWSGLGYYRRAHALHEAAQQVVTEHDGVFPSSEEALLRLPGCGPYTAAAVAAIAFNQSANVVDGNVERVVARLFAFEMPLPKGRPVLRALAATLVPNARGGDYAQARMDLGSTVCTPRLPACETCPWRATCLAHRLGTETTFPRRTTSKTPRRRLCGFAFVIRDAKGLVLLRLRPPKGLLGGTLGVPTSPWEESPVTLGTARSHAPTAARWTLMPEPVRHVFSHFDLELQVAVATTAKPLEGRWVAPEDFPTEALSTLMRKVLARAGVG